MDLLSSSWIGIIFLGFFAGLLARVILSGKPRLGLIMTILLGVVGAVVAAWIIDFFQINLIGRFTRFAAAVAGSVLVLWFYQSLRKK